MTEHESLLCLNAVSGLGSQKIQCLLKFFRSGKAVWKQHRKKLSNVEGIGKKLAENIIQFDCDGFLKNEKDLMRKHKVEVVSFFDESYPEYLRQIYDFPVVLYVCGCWKITTFPGIAVVGSRRASIYGQSVAKLFGSHLAQHDISVVSGMARGIDTAAHYGCLEVGGKTVAVLGSGLARIYPPENKFLFEKIADSGCVVSEFPMETGPIAGNFPRRNRIISGLSAGVIVVEAAARSGALITSRCALEHGREVFAVPGKIGQSQAAGTNRLIQQGAKLISSIDDVLEELPCFADCQKDLDNVSSKSVSNVSESEKQILKILDDDPVYIDDMLMNEDLNRNDLVQILLKLELNGMIKRLPGNYFIKNVGAR